MTCACGSGEHYADEDFAGCIAYLSGCVAHLAGRLAALEAKSAVPPQSASCVHPDYNAPSAVNCPRCGVDALPAPKQERPLADGWSVFPGSAQCERCGGRLAAYGGRPNLGLLCEPCAEAAGVFAPLASAESPGVTVVSEGPPTRSLAEILANPPRLIMEPQPAAAPTCKDWCGLVASDVISKNVADGVHWRATRGFCTAACFHAGTSLNPNPEPQPAAATAPVTREAALRALSVLHRETMSGRVGHDWHASYVEVDTFIREREAREAALLARGDDYKRAWQRDLDKGREFQQELASAREQLEGCKRHCTSIEAELAAERAKSAAPAPGGTNPADDDPLWAVRWAGEFLNQGDGSVPAKAFDALVDKLQDVAREAEARGRNAAHGEKARAWRALGEQDHEVFWRATATSEDFVSSYYGERGLLVMSVARAALAELAGTEGT